MAKPQNKRSLNYGSRYTQRHEEVFIYFVGGAVAFTRRVGRHLLSGDMDCVQRGYERNLRGMIERYTIKFGPAVSQKELEKALHESGGTPSNTNLTKMKARIEIIADFEDLKRISELLKELEKK